MQARYVHTNLIANDWQALATFYVQVFGCTPVPPERDFAGAELEAGTGIDGAHLSGTHLLLPGHGDGGPTLEIFSYTPALQRPPDAVNRPGWGHIAFQVDDVAAARAEVLAAGGSSIGEIVTLPVTAAAYVTWTYLSDPEGNIIELQSWS